MAVIPVKNKLQKIFPALTILPLTLTLSADSLKSASGFNGERITVTAELKIDWSLQKKKNLGAATLLNQSATVARAMALRDLAAAVGQTQVTAEDTVESFSRKNSIIKTRLAVVLRGALAEPAEFLPVKSSQPDTVRVRASLAAYGNQGLLNGEALEDISRQYSQYAAGEITPSNSKNTYTGLIIAPFGELIMSHKY